MLTRLPSQERSHTSRPAIIRSRLPKRLLTGAGPFLLNLPTLDQLAVFEKAIRAMRISSVEFRKSWPMMTSGSDRWM